MECFKKYRWGLLLWKRNLSGEGFVFVPFHPMANTLKNMKLNEKLICKVHSVLRSLFKHCIRACKQLASQYGPDLGKQILLCFFCFEFSANMHSLIDTLNCLFRLIERGFYTLPAYDGQAPSNYFDNVHKHTLVFRFFSQINANVWCKNLYLLGILKRKQIFIFSYSCWKLGDKYFASSF